MALRNTVLAQYQQLLDRTAAIAGAINAPAEGWIRTARKALGMSGAQLGKRMGASRAQVSHFEQREVAGNVTVDTLKRAAAAMGCRFVYAIVPNTTAGELLGRRTREKAEKIVARTHQHMALEAQILSPAQIAAETAILQQELMRDMPADLWNDE